jgi:hypothetical protein
MGTWVMEALLRGARPFKIRRSPRRTPLQQLCFARQRLADEVPDEATNDNVFAEFGNLGIQ